MIRDRIDSVILAIYARAAEVGRCKTRLIPVLGKQGAAIFQTACLEHTLNLATEHFERCALWCYPDTRAEGFHSVINRYSIDAYSQPPGDLGEKMLGTFARHCQLKPTLLIGTDCPTLTGTMLREAAEALLTDSQVVLMPAEDGGYALIGMQQPFASLFEGIEWGSATVLRNTRKRITQLRLRSRELPTVWDVDRPEDLERLRVSDISHPGREWMTWRHD